MSGDRRIRVLRRFCPLRLRLLFRVHVREQTNQLCVTWEDVALCR